MRALVLALTMTVLMAGEATAAGPCRDPGAQGFVCTTLSVPLDREGVRRGTLKLPVAYEPARRGAKGILIALSGGPGQGSIAAAEQFLQGLEPALGSARLVVFDQRGTGATALKCPELQGAGAVEGLAESAVAACAKRLGPARADYSTADTVADIEALRRRFGAAKVTLMGISYGTYVAAQYARTYPDHVRGLILDSALAPAGVDPYLLDTLGPLKRVVDGWCTGVPCPVSARRPWTALEQVVARLQRGPLTAMVPDARGRKRKRTIANETDLGMLIGSVDLNPALQALMPGALAAAADGDAAPLLRLVPAAAGAPFTAQEFSVGLNVATVCADVALPFSFADSGAVRQTKTEAALDAVPAELYAPFSRSSVLSGSVAHDCAVWPEDAGAARPSTAPLPNVPTLILSGSFDQRTPTEGARQMASQIGRSQLVVVRGTGHDTIDTDFSGCVARALARFGRGLTVGQPCAGIDNRFRVLERPARALSPGDSGVVSAFVATLEDVGLQATAQLFGGLRVQRGGGLRGGTFSSGAQFTMRGYELIDGVRVSTIGSSGNAFSVTLPDGRRARFSVSGNVVRGVIGGRRVRRVIRPFGPTGRASAAVARAAGHYVSRR